MVVAEDTVVADAEDGDTRGELSEFAAYGGCCLAHARNASRIVHAEAVDMILRQVANWNHCKTQFVPPPTAQHNPGKDCLHGKSDNDESNASGY